MSGGRDRRGEEGSSLLIALIFVLVFSLFVAAVISFTEVGLLSTRSFASRTKVVYAADAAVKAAIQRYADGGACDDYTAPLAPDGTAVNGNAMVVHCGAGSRTSAPVNALLSLGDVPLEDGITSTADLRVLGSIVSNSTVSAGGTLVVQGEVSAQGNCTPLPNIQTAPPVPLHCLNSNPPADPGLGRDPDYTSGAGVVPVRRTVPPCPTAAPRIVALQPGYYDDDQLPRLNALTTAGACPDTVVWFRPGVYYLDFTFLRGAAAPDAGKWTVSEPSVHVVGGTPAGWEADGDPLPVAVPGTCQTEGPGVRMIMGGQSTRLEVTAGKVEFCAEPSATEQQIAIFGLRAAMARHLLAPTEIVGASDFAGTTNAMTIGEQPPPPPAGPAPGPLTAVAVLSQEAPSASITLAGFRPTIPAGSVIDSATLRVAHQDDPGVSAVTVSAAGEVAGPTCQTPHPLTLRPTLITEEPAIDLMACGLTTPAAFNSLAVTYTATTAGTTQVSDQLDGVAVEVAYRPPGTRKPTVVTASSNFSTPDRAFEIGELDAADDPLTAKATLGGAVTSASLTVAGLADPPIPPGSTIDAAVLRVAHTDTGDVAAGSPTVTVGPCAAQPLTVFPTGGEDRVDLKACGPVTDATLAALTATYQVGLAAGGNAVDELDGMWLELVYTPPFVTTAATTATPGAVFTGVNNSTALDGVTADASLGGAVRSAALTVSNFAVPPPTGPGLDAAVIRARHREDGAAGPVTLSATWTGGAGGSCSATFPPHPGSLVDDRLDLHACGFGDASLAGLSVTYTTVQRSAGGTATSQLDGIVLDLAHAPAAVRRPTVTSAVDGFANPDNARVIGGAPVLTADAAPGATAASFSVGGFDEPIRIPAGSAIDSAVLRVSHQDDGPIGPVGLTATFPGSTPSCGVAALPLHPGAQGVDFVDLGSCGLRDVSQLTLLTATYTAEATADTTRPATSVPASTFANGANAMTIDGTSAQAALDTTGSAPASASITLAGYDVTVPPEATLDSAVLKVAHRDDAPVGPVTVAVAWTGGAGGSCVMTLPSRPTVLGQDLVSLKDCGLADLADLPGLSVTYTANLTTAGAIASDFLDGITLQFATTRVDGVALDVVFRPPGMRPLSGCLTAGPYPGTGCALVKVAPAGVTAAERISTRFSSKGTIYAPSAALDISMEGLNRQVLTRGLIARTIRLGLVADPGFNRPTSGVPPEAVVFTAYPASQIRNDIRAVTANATDFGIVANALAIGGGTADAVIDPAAPPLTRTITLGGFSEPSLPAGTVIEAAELRVAHRDETGIASAAVTFDFAGKRATCNAAVELPLHAGGLVEDRVDLESCDFNSPSQLAGLTVGYTAAADPAATGTATDRLDGIVLVVRFAPVVRASVAFDRGRATVREWSVLR